MYGKVKFSSNNPFNKVPRKREKKKFLMNYENAEHLLLINFFENIFLAKYKREAS